MVMLNFDQVPEYNLDDAFGKVVMENWRMFCHIAYQVVGNYDEAEEIALEAVAKVCGVLRREPIKTIFAYLNKAVYQVALDRLERRDREISLELFVEQEPDFEFRSPSYVIEILEKMDEVECVMQFLPSHMAQSVRLRYLSDWPFERIAHELGRPVSTVKSDVRRGLKRIRREILTARKMYAEVA